jgi:NAD(P)-dependent dehydrogenase (short-subunit alcohol dehydrogenase family)
MIDYGIAGKVAMVTGAGKGIGRETAIQLAKQGAAVVLVGRTEGPLKEVESIIRQTTDQVLSIRCDVAAEADVKQAVEQALQRFGRIDILVNNAGIEVDREPGQMGGVIPKEFIPAIDAGVKEAMNTGVLAGYPVIDVKVAADWPDRPQQPGAWRLC